MNLRSATRIHGSAICAAGLVAAILTGHSVVHAGGLQALPAQARGAALGSATVALSSEPEDFSRNPALLGSLEGTRLTLGAGLVIPEFRFVGIMPSPQETKAEPVFLFPPSFALSFAINEQVGVGLSGEAPFLARSEWNSSWVGRQLATSFEYRTGVLAPAISYSPLEGFSLGLSVPLKLTKHVMTSWVIEPGAGATPGEAYQKTIEGESGVNVGFQAGVLVTGGTWSIGGSYTMGGDVTISDAEASLSTTDPQPSRETYEGKQASISTSLPSEWAVGATLHPMPELLLTSEFDLILWSAARKIQYEIPGTTDSYAILQEWDDSYRIAFGAEYTLSEICLRAGISYDATPVPDATAHPAYPDADRYGYSVGLGYRVGPGLLLDFAVSAFAFNERTVESSELTITDEVSGTPGQAFNGTYKTSTTSISISVSYLWR
jgi:long-chain fatty acid transport protein